MDNYRKIYNGTIKVMLKLPRSTPHALIDRIMDSWSAETVCVQNYVRNANLWYRTYENEIREGRVNELYEEIRSRYVKINEKIGGH